MRRQQLASLLLAGLAAAFQAPAAEPEPEFYGAVMIGTNVAPEPVNTTASGGATAVLSGRVLTVHGAFQGLSSRLRDLAETPGNPGVHLHPGGPGETAPYLYGLAAELSPDGPGGIFQGRFRLGVSEVQMLRDGELYLNIHTSAYPDGEIRGQLLPLSGQSRGTVNEGVGEALEH